MLWKVKCQKLNSLLFVRKCKVVTLNFVQWCIANNYPTAHDVLSHIHAGLRSAKQTKTYKKWYEKETLRLQQLVVEAKLLYSDAVLKCDVINPDDVTSKEKLIRTASGHPDNESVMAARRLLLKRYELEII